MKNKHFITGLCTALIALVADQASKEKLLDLLDFGQRPVIEITSFFNLAMVWNRGVSFGMFARHDQPLLLIFISLFICVFLLRWLLKCEERMVALALGLVIGGALGNVIDRIRFGAVADFFDFHLFGYHWPAFNIADASIFIGVVVLCWHSMLTPPKKEGAI
jgi:signal peptidase II